MNEKVFLQKLMELSKSTMQKISALATSEEVLHEIYNIVMENQTEQEILKKLKELEGLNGAIKPKTAINKGYLLKNKT